MHFRTFIFISVNKILGIFIGIALNLQIAFGRMVILGMLVLLIHEHDMLFHILAFFLNILLQVFEIYIVEVCCLRCYCQQECIHDLFLKIVLLVYKNNIDFSKLALGPTTLL